MDKSKIDFQLNYSNRSKVTCYRSLPCCGTPANVSCPATKINLQQKTIQVLLPVLSK